MRKTAAQWFNDLPDDVRGVVIKECTQEALSKEYFSLTSAVLLSFDWMSSKAGPFYYRRLHTELRWLDKEREQRGVLSLMMK